MVVGGAVVLVGGAAVVVCAEAAGAVLAAAGAEVAAGTITTLRSAVLDRATSANTSPAAATAMTPATIATGTRQSGAARILTLTGAPHSRHQSWSVASPAPQSGQTVSLAERSASALTGRCVPERGEQ